MCRRNASDSRSIRLGISSGLMIRPTRDNSCTPTSSTTSSDSTLYMNVQTMSKSEMSK